MAEDIIENKDDMGFEESVIVLQNEDGEEIEFHHIATLDYQGEWYIFIQPVELGDMEEDEMLIFKIESDENGDDLYVPVEDEETINAVYAEFMKECDECDCDDCDCEECEGECECESENKSCGCDCGCDK